MKSVKFGGKTAGGSVVRVLALAVACALVVVAGLLPGASAQQKSGGPSKLLPGTVAGSAKVSPAGASRAKVKEGGAKWAAGAGGEVAPLALGCANPDSTIAANQTVNGTLATGDCTLGDGSFFDAYTFSGTAGQQVNITMASSQVDAYLYLMQPGETALSDNTIQDDDTGNGVKGTDARISITLPTTGTYTIIANSFASGQTGSYTLSVVSRPVCTPTLVQMTPSAGSVVTATGTLATTDCSLDDGSFIDVFTFNGTAGQQVAVAMSSAFDNFLFLVGPDGDELARNDNGAGGTNARIPAGGGGVLARLPQTGTYRVVANSLAASATGSYTIFLELGASSCPATAITPGTPVNGDLATTDCRLPADGSFIDTYTFNGTAGQNVSITMTSSAFDTYLFLLAPGGSELAFDDNHGGGANAHIPSSDKPTFTGVLPVSGTYTIYANSSVIGLTGPYTLTLTGGQAACTYALTAAGRTVGAGGGTFTDNFTTQAGCAAPSVASNAAFITSPAATVDGAGAGTLTYTVAANTGAQRAGTITVGTQTFTVTQGAGTPACDVTIYPPVQPFTQGGGTGRFTVFPAGSCSWTATTTTPWITINSPTAATAGTGRVRYSVAANPTSATRTGSIVVGTKTYVVTQTAAATTPQVQFSNATYSVNEGDATKSITITVVRIGDSAGAATVEYRTVDDLTAIPCNPADTPAAQRGKALARCDYSTNLDTLTFDIGQTVKTFTIPLINDTHVEGNESFQIALQNPQGAAAGSQQTATVTIVDDDTVQSAFNPINQTPLFIRMQYLDFLSREPEPGEPWSAVINGCPNPFNRPNNDPSANCDRIKVSSAFFGSDEFRVKGFFVFLYYKVSFGSQATPNFVPQYDEIVSDMRRITGSSTEERVDKTFNFAEDWVTRPAFVARYGAKSNAQFVDELLANVGASLASPDPVSGQTRNSLVAALDAGTKTRAEVLRIIVESGEVNAVQTNHAFVAMQYYGYLRRTPEPGGYTAWLNTINPPTSANPRDMVNGFLNSDEYFLRFGPNVRQ